MAKSSILLALNSLSSDRMVCLTTKDHEQSEELVEDCINANDGSDNDSSGSDNEMEYGKYWLILINECTDEGVLVCRWSLCRGEGSIALGEQ